MGDEFKSASMQKQSNPTLACFPITDHASHIMGVLR